MKMEVRLSREMRLLDITMIGVGAMIGAGIFVLTGIAAGVAGPALVVAFLLNGFVALLTAGAYAELGSAFHDAGGGYLWVKSSLPNPNGFLSGWMSWFAHAVACSLYALGFGAYFRMALSAFGVQATSWGGLGLEKWLAVLACTAFAWINYRGAAEAGKAGNVVTVAKIAVIGVFLAAGLAVMAQKTEWQVSFEPFFENGWGGVFAAMGLTFIAFEGYEIIAQTSEEVENPKRNVPRAIFLSLLIVVPIYLLVAVVAVGAVIAPEGISVTAFLAREKELALVAAADQFARGGGIVILVGGLLSTLSALNATIYSSSRVAFAMARDANLPAAVGAVHARRATPHIAILLSIIIIIVMAVALPIEDVAAAADVMFLLLFMQVNLALVRLRKLRPDLERGFRVPWVPLVPYVAIAAMLVLTVFLFLHYPKAWFAIGGWLVAGFAVYYGYSRTRETAHEARERWMERLERKEFQVLVAVSSARTMPSLMEVGIALAGRHGGDIVAVTVAEVPEGETLMAGRRVARELEPLLAATVEYAAQRGVTARPVLKLSRRISHGIVETAREEECNFLVIGRPARNTFLERLVASIVERVLVEAPCQVGVVYGTLRPASVTGVVLPVQLGANAKLAAHFARAFSERYAAPVRALTVLAPDASESAAEQRVSEARALVGEASLQANVEVLRAWDAGRELVGALEPGELVIVGAPTADPVAALLGETVPGVIASESANPVLMVRDVPERHYRRIERFFLGTD